MNLPGRPRRIAFFGGSFDPPHRGHLAVARAAQVALALDAVLFAPVGAQPLKPHGATASFGDRMAMTRLAIQDQTEFEISDADAPAAEGTHNYTIDTLLRLRREFPPGTELFCLMGADSFLNLKKWHRGAEIPFTASLVVAARPGQPFEGTAEVLPEGVSIDLNTAETRSCGGITIRKYSMHSQTGATAPFFLLPGLHLGISASEIRRQIQAALGCPGECHDPLPALVCDYIATHGLYR